MSVTIALPFEPIQGISGDQTFSPAQIDLIRNVAAGRDTSFSRIQALELLQGSTFSDKIRDLQLLLENGQESSEIRHLSARGLYKVNTPEAVDILLRNSQVEDERVLTTVMKGLGRIGSENALEAIARVRDRATGVAAFHAEFAAALISHRFGLSGNDLRVPDNSEYLQIASDMSRSFQVAKASENEAQACLQSLADQPFGIEYSENNLYQIQCGRNNWMLILNQEFANQDAVQALQLRKAFPGIIAAKYEETGLYSTAFLLFTSPTEQPNILNLLVHRSTGEQVFGGTAQVEGSKANFSIRSLSRPGGFPVNVEGSFEGGNLNFETTLSGTQVQERRHPTKVVPSASKTVLVTNLDQPNRATTMVPSDAGWAAQSFVTDDSDYWLESIEIIAGNLVGTPSIIAELRVGDATSLGDTLGTFTVPDLTTGTQNVKLTPNNPVRLSPNTTYWLVLGTSGDGTFGWTYAEGNEQAGSGTLGQYAYSEDQGVTWNTNNPDSNPYKLEVLVHPIPAQ